MPRLSDIRGEVVEALLDARPPSPPGGDPAGAGRFGRIARVLVGLVADPRVADRALEALEAAGLLDPRALGSAGAAEVDDVLKGAGVRFPGAKLGPLRKVAAWVAAGGLGPDPEDQDGPGRSTESIRDDLRAINGVGPASADAVLLFALGRVAYPVDRPTYRILARHGWLDPSADYDEARSVLESLGPDDPARLARVAPALAAVAQAYCKAGNPRCDRCPLRPWLPEGGPVGAE